MALWAKRLFSVVALALQSLVVVVLWTRLFIPNACRPSWQMEMFRWSLLAVWIASIVFWQLVFGVRRWFGVIRGTVAACVISGGLVFLADFFRPNAIYIPAKMAMGEGGWSYRIGDAEMIVNGRRVAYEVRVGNVIDDSLRPVNGLMLISKEPFADRELGRLNCLVASRNELCAARLQVLRLPFVSDPTICRGMVSLRPRGKAEIFKTWKVRDIDGVREYDCALTYWYGTCRRILLRIPEEFYSPTVCAQQHTMRESYRLLEMVVDCVLLSDEWNDCITEEDENSDEGIEIVYPTMFSVFESLSNSVYSSWSISEREGAFVSCIESAAHTNEITLSKEVISNIKYGLLISDAKNYTNVLHAAKSIVMARNAPCKEEALSVVLKFSSPSIELNNLILSVSTNSNDYLRFTCYDVVNDYFEKLKTLHTDDRFVATNAAGLFYKNRDKVLNLFATDKMLKSVYDDYSASTNRFLLSMTALARPNLTSIERAYFESVTNSLHSTTQPLVDVPGL